MAANLTTKLGQLVDVLTPDTTNTRIGVANASPTRTLDVTGTGGFSGLLTAAGGVSSTLTTDATSATTGSIITAGGISTQKALWVGTTSRHVGATQFDAAITYGGVTLSNAVTGTGNMVLSASPTLTGTLTAAAANYSGIILSDLGGGGNAYTARFNSSNSRAGVYVLGSSGYPLFGSNLTWSSGNVLNYDRTTTAWSMGDYGDGAFGIWCATGTAGNDSGFGSSTTSRRLTISNSGTVTLSGALTYGGVTLSNAVTGTGNMVLSASPTLTGTLTAAAVTASGRVTGSAGGTFGPTVSGGSTVTTFISSDNSTDQIALEVRQGRYNKDALILSTNQTNSANFLNVIENGSSKFTISTNGNTAITGTLGVTGAVTITNSSGLTVNTGASSTILLASAGTATTYNFISLNGANANSAAGIGLEGGATGDLNLYYNTVSGGTHIFRVGSGGSYATNMTLSASGLGIGRTPTQIFQAKAGTDQVFSLTSAGGHLQIQAINDAANAYTQMELAGSIITFSPASTEAARFDASRNFQFGTTTSVGAASFGVTMFPNGSVQVSQNTTGAAAVLAFYNPNGAVGTIQTSGSSTSYVTSSDYRLKENVQPMTGGLATVAALKPVNYDWICDKSTGEGFIAHELQAVIPAAVTGEKDAVDDKGEIKPQGVDFGKIVPHLVAAIQELTTRLAALESK